MRLGRDISWLALLAALALSAGCEPPSVHRPPVDPSPQRAEFEQIFDQWKPFLDELRQVREQYAVAEPDLRPELQERYDGMVKKGDALEAQLVDAAVLACVEHPEENEDLADFLMSIVRDLLMNEEYEECLRMAQIVIDHEVGEHVGDFYSIYYCAAIAAFAAGEFDIAEKHFQLLDKKEIRLQGKETMAQRNPMKEVVRECKAQLPYYQEAWQREQALREQEKIAGNLPRVRLATSKGDIELELFENEAPNTVANFVSLVENGFYDGLTFHLVKPRSAAQAGCPNGNGSGHPGYTIRDECYQPNHRLHFRGSLSMASRGPNTGGSQFFITFRPMREFDGNNTVFGRVVRGIGVLSRLQRREPDPTIPEELLPKPDKILRAEVLSKRNHSYEPKITPIEEPDEMTKKILEEFPEGFAPF
jgi:cyclophilin family peptidyl-prolyl cis-trans isomerase